MPPFLRAATLFILAVLPLVATAQNPPPQMESRAFRIPPDFSSAPPSLQRPKATDILKAQGITFPPGASATFYPAAGILVTRNTPENLALITAFIDDINRQGPKVIALTAHLVQAAGVLLRPLVSGQAEQTEVLKQLLTQPEVQVLHTLHVHTKSGQRCTIESITEHEYTAKLPLDAKGRSAIEGEMRPLGFRVEFDPVIGGDGDSINLNLAPEFTVLWQKPRQETVGDPLSGGPVKMAIPEFQTAKLQTATRIQSGHTVLAAIWPAKGDPQLASADLCQAVFITAHVLPLAPPADSHLPPLSKDPDAFVEEDFVMPQGLLDANTSTAPEDIERLLPLNGIDLPPGSRVSLNPAGSLHIRTTAEMMQVVEAWTETFTTRFRPPLNFTTEIIRAPAAMIRSLIHESAGRTDHTPALRKLHTAITQGQAKQVMLTHLETHSGQRSVAHAYLDRHLLKELSWHGTPQPALTTLHRPTGLTLELDPVISLGGIIDVNYAIEHHHAPPTPWQETLSDPASKLSFVLPRNEFHLAHIQTADVFIDGRPKLIGAWRPVFAGGKSGEDVLEAGFMTCRIVRKAPAVPAFVKPPPAPAPAENQELHTRMFNVPPDFLTLGAPRPAAAPSEDPFKAEPQVRLTALEILKARGVTFPEGSVATFNPVTSRLSVRNTAANLGRVEDYVKSLTKAGPSSINLTLHLLELPASLALELLTAHAADSNHAPALKALLAEPPARVRHLATLHGTTKSGERISVSQAQEHAFLREIKVPKDGGAEVNRETVPVGSLFEAEATIAGDGLTIDVNFDLRHHPAPPAPHLENLAPAGAEPIEVPLVDFHVEKYLGAISLRSGAARVLALWKPPGKVEMDVLHIAILEARVVGMQEEGDR